MVIPSVYRLLVVEDDWKDRLALQYSLTNVGFKTKAVRNGKECLSLWEEWQPDLIWMELRMPVMDGIRTINLIRSHLKGQTLRIIALTASMFEQHRVQALSSGYTDFVAKPFEEHIIFDYLARYLNVSYLFAFSSTEINKETIPSPSFESP